MSSSGVFVLYCLDPKLWDVRSKPEYEAWSHEIEGKGREEDEDKSGER